MKDLADRLLGQDEENTILHKLHTRQAEQLAAIGLSAPQRAELFKMTEHKSELARQLRAFQLRTQDLTRKQHAAQLAWSSLEKKRERLEKGIAGGPIAALIDGGSTAEHDAQIGLDKVTVRLEHARKNLKVAASARSGQGKRHTARMAAADGQIKILRRQVDDLAIRLGEPRLVFACAATHSNSSDKLTAASPSMDTAGVERATRDRNLRHAIAATVVQAATRGRRVRSRKAVCVRPSPQATAPTAHRAQLLFKSYTHRGTQVTSTVVNLRPQTEVGQRCLNEIVPALHLV